MSGLEELGKRLRRARDARGVELSALAEVTGMDLERLRAFEAGELAVSSVEVLRLARELRVAPQSLLHASAPEDVARSPAEALLKRTGSSFLDPVDHGRLENALDLAESFHHLGELLGVEQLCLKFGPKPAPKSNAWQAGYDDAEAARALIDRRTGHLESILAVVEDRFDILVLPVRFDTPGVLGATARVKDARVILLSDRVRRANTLRWLLAHELAHQLRDLSADGGAFADDAGEVPLLTKPPVEQRADAFAYMFLAPRAALHDFLGPPRGAMGDAAALSLTERAALHFGVSFDPMARHLANLGYFEAALAEELQGRGRPESTSTTGLPEENGLARRARQCLERHHITEREALKLIEASASVL